MGQSDSGKFSATKVKKVLDLIKDETQFLLDMKVRDQLAELPPEQRDVLQIDALLRYIGVEGQQDVDLLVQVFYNGQEEDDEALMVEPDDVLQHLKNFIQEKAGSSSRANSLLSKHVVNSVAHCHFLCGILCIYIYMYCWRIYILLIYGNNIVDDWCKALKKLK